MVDAAVSGPGENIYCPPGVLSCFHPSIEFSGAGGSFSLFITALVFGVCEVE